MPVQHALGAVIKARRIELSWTQETLAERISADGELVRQSEISRIESGKIALPRRERLERIAKALDLPLGELLARSGWSGARESFQQPDLNAAVTPQSVVEPDMPSDKRMRDLHVVEGMRVDASDRRLDVEASSSDAVRELRQALQRMRVEAERLSHNREQALAIGRLVDERLDCAASGTSDQSEATGC